MSKAGVLDAAFLVDLLAGFKSELNDKVWSEISAVLGGLEKAGSGAAACCGDAKMTPPQYSQRAHEKSSVSFAYH